MKNKILLAALSLPLVFAACSQDDFVNNETGMNESQIKAKGYRVALNVTGRTEAGEGADTRATYDSEGDKVAFEAGDALSIYWLGESSEGEGGTDWSTGIVSDDASGLTGKFNSVFKKQSAGDGGEFTSEAMVFVGGNVAVYPADKTFVKEGALQISVPQTTTEKSLKELPYISNQLNIVDDGKGQNSAGYYGAGGQAALSFPIKLAANVVKLTMNMTNIPEGFDFEVESVDLEGDEGSFALISDLKRVAGTVANKGEFGTGNAKKETIANVVWTTPATSAEATAAKVTSEALTNAKPTASNKQVVVRFALLPTQTATDLNNAKIVVRTNCGTITLVDKETYAETDLRPVVKSNSDGTITRLTIKEAMKSFLQANTSASEDFSGEKVCGRMQRSIEVDCSKAVLNGSKVYDNAGIERYLKLYKAMNKDDNMTLVLSSKLTGDDLPACFPAVEQATVNGINATGVNINLIAEADVIGSVEITGSNVFTIPNLLTAQSSLQNVTGATEVPLVLKAGDTWTMDDTFALKADGKTTNPLSKIVNNGTLTIKGTTTRGTQNTVEETIVNQGTINLEGNLVKFGTLETAAGSVVNVTSNQELTFANDINSGLNGKIVVAENGFVTVSDGKTVVNDGTIDNSGTLAATAETNGWTNMGEINVLSDNAITYVQDNSNGVINLKNRNDEVKVADGKEGVIKYQYRNDEDGAVLKSLEGDKFTWVVFDGSLTKLTLDNGAELSGVTLEFKGNPTQLISDGQTIDVLQVNSGANLRFLTGNTLNTTKIVNNGTITLGGTIYCPDTTPEGTGRVLRQGSGSIVESTVGSTTGANNSEELAAAVNNTEIEKVILNNSLTLGSAVAVSGTKEIDLNGRTLAGTTNVATVGTGATLKISGGTLSSSAVGNNYTNSEGGHGLSLITVEKDGVVELDGVTCNFASASYTGGQTNEETCAVYANAGNPEGSGSGTTTILRNCKISANAYGVATNANVADANYNGLSIVIENCEISAETPVAINVPTTVSIKNSELTGTWQAMMVRGGTAVCENVQFIRTGTYSDRTGEGNSWGSGNQVAAAVITLGNKTSTSAYQYPTNVTLTGCNLDKTGVGSGVTIPAIYAASMQNCPVTLTYTGCTGFEESDIKTYKTNDGSITINGQSK